MENIVFFFFLLCIGRGLRYFLFLRGLVVLVILMAAALGKQAAALSLSLSLAKHWPRPLSPLWLTCHVSPPLQKMAKRRFSGLEITLMVLFLLMLAVAVAMIALYFVDPRSNSNSNSEDGVTEGWWADCCFIDD